MLCNVQAHTITHAIIYDTIFLNIENRINSKKTCEDFQKFRYILHIIYIHFSLPIFKYMHFLLECVKNNCMFSVCFFVVFFF